ncbi:MAG: class I SAM-dependent methyltransferase [Asgard group archaeon]|nr:class I SAM-dependent methyltransferase [Asgard group archaeon]
MTSSESGMCFYCKEYYQITKNYPLNEATYDVDSFTPRCYLHWEYECSKCGRMIHFNGIAWCSSCKEFTCKSCVEEKMVKEEFLIYDYYYNIPCHKCDKLNPALDFAEYNGTHPFQIGGLKPEEEIVVWMPIYKEELKSQEFPHQAWGSERILSTGKSVRHKRLESLDDYTPKSTWDVLASKWVSPEEEEEYHHTHLILPDVYRMLDAQKDEEILDVACGEGTVVRYLAKLGAKVTGIDISNMIDRAIEREKKDELGICLLKLNAEELHNNFERGSFDKVVCNMALMDIANYKVTIKNIAYVLKENGTFIFSIVHPAFGWPATTTLRIPKGSRRNEDRLRVLQNYFDERPALIDYSEDYPNLCFHRPISSYINELINNSLEIIEMCEPKASEELVQRFPGKAYLDNDIFAEFLIVKTRKKSNN